MRAITIIHLCHCQKLTVGAVVVQWLTLGDYDGAGDHQYLVRAIIIAHPHRSTTTDKLIVGAVVVCLLTLRDYDAVRYHYYCVRATTDIIVKR